MKSRKIHTLGLTVLLCLVFLTTSLGNGLIIGITQIPSAGLVSSHSGVLYTVSKDGIYTVLSEGGGEITRNTDARTIINQAITLANTISGSVLIMNETYSLNGNINMKSNIAVYLQLGVTLNVTAFAPTSRQGDINFNGVTNVNFVTATDPTSESSYPQVIGAATSNYECGVYMTGGTTHCTVGKIAFSNIGGNGICIANANYNVFNGTYVHGFTKVNGNNHMGVTIRYGSYNKLINVHADAEKGQYVNHSLYLGGEGPVTHNEIRGGIYENSAISHASYWCSDDGAVDSNLCVGTTFKGCRGEGYATGLKFNAATNNRIGIDSDGTLNPVMLIDCEIGFAMGDGGGVTGSHGNIVYAIVRNCYKGSEWFTQSSKNVENNEVHLDIGVDSNYPTTGRPATYAFDFGGFHAIAGSSYVQNNTIYLKVRNYQYGVVFSGWDQPESATQEARYNTFYLDLDAIGKFAIYWMGGSTGCGGYGRWNTYYGTWRSNQAGNCGSIPNADYVYTEVGTAVVATNTFSPD